MSNLGSTHTLAELEISAGAYDEIRGKLEEAGYQHAFGAGGVIDMHGIGVTRALDVLLLVEGKNFCVKCGDELRSEEEAIRRGEGVDATAFLGELRRELATDHPVIEQADGDSRTTLYGDGLQATVTGAMRIQRKMAEP